MKISRINIFIIILPLVLSLIDILNISNTNFHNHFSKFHNTDFDEQIYWYLVQIMLSLIILMAYSIFSNVKPNTDKFENPKFNKNEERLHNIILMCFFLIAMYKVFVIIQYGFIEYLLKSRMGLIPQGFIGHMLLIYLPMLLAMEFKINTNRLYFCLIFFVFTFLCISTGYRIHFIIGLLMIFIMNLHYFRNLKFYKVFTFFSIILISIYFFETLREEYFGGSYADRNLLDSLNRTNPISFISYIDSRNLNIDFGMFLQTFITPFSTILSHFGFTEDHMGHSIMDIYQKLFHSYLSWRGTPEYMATGFSMGFFATAFMFGGILGLCFFSIVYGIILAFAKYFYLSRGYVSQLFGGSLMVFLIYCNETPVEGVKSLVYWIFLFFIFSILLRLMSLLGKVR